MNELQIAARKALKYFDVSVLVTESFTIEEGYEAVTLLGNEVILVVRVAVDKLFPKGVIVSAQISFLHDEDYEELNREDLVNIKRLFSRATKRTPLFIGIDGFDDYICMN